MSSTTPSLRKRLLHILLWCLSASAASGVLTVLVPSNNIMWRVTALGFVAVVAIGLMIPLSLLADRERFRAAGLFGMFACVGAFLVSVALIWAEPFGWRMEDRLGMTLGLIFLMSPAVVGFLCLRALESGRVAGFCGLVFAVAATVCFLVAIWVGSLSFFDQISSRMALTGVAISWAGLPAALCLIGFGRDRWYWRWLGIGGSAAALVLWLNGIWADLDGDPAFVVCPMSIACFVAFANVMLRSSLRGGQRLIVYGTVAAAAAVALFVDLIVLTHSDDLQDAFGFQRFTAGASIVTVSGTLAVIVLTMLNRRADRRVARAVRSAPDTAAGPPAGGGSSAGEVLKAIWVRCPRCQKEQTLPLGEAACSECRLVIRTSVEPPACPKCGYDVSMIRGDKCPECGDAIG